MFPFIIVIFVIIFKLEFMIFNEIEIQLLELLDYNFSCIDVSKWIEE